MLDDKEKTATIGFYLHISGEISRKSLFFIFSLIIELANSFFFRT